MNRLHVFPAIVFWCESISAQNSQKKLQIRENFPRSWVDQYWNSAVKNILMASTPYARRFPRSLSLGICSSTWNLRWLSSYFHAKMLCVQSLTPMESPWTSKYLHTRSATINGDTCFTEEPTRLLDRSCYFVSRQKPRIRLHGLGLRVGFRSLVGVDAILRWVGEILALWISRHEPSRRPGSPSSRNLHSVMLREGITSPASRAVNFDWVVIFRTAYRHVNPPSFPIWVQRAFNVISRSILLFLQILPIHPCSWTQKSVCALILEILSENRQKVSNRPLYIRVLSI
jgi:hypothetical protein